MKGMLKRVFALVLCLALVLGGISTLATVTSRAASGQENMSVESVLNSQHNGDWRFNFNMNGTWPTTGDFDSYTTANVKVTIKNAANETLATVETGALENYKNGQYWLLVIWGAYTASNAPAVGDTITISSGQLTYVSDASKSVNFAKETVLQYDGTQWLVYVPRMVEEMSVQSVYDFSTNNGDWRFNFNMNGTWPTTGDFEEYLNTSLIVTVKNAAEKTVATIEGATLACYKNGPYWLLAIWGVYTQSNAPAAGDTITISSGQLTSSADSTKVVNFAEEMVLEYDGENWGEEAVEYTYTDVELVWGEYPSNKPNAETGYWDLYVDTSEMLPGTTWLTVYGDIKVVVGEKEIAASVKKAGDKLLNIFIMDDTTLPVTAPAGTKITIKSGTSLGSDLGAEGINILEDFTMVLGEDGMLSKYVEPVVYTYTDMELVWGEYPSNKPNIEAGYWDLYVETNEVLPGTTWLTVYGDIKVVVGEKEIAASVKKARDKLLNIFIMDDTTLPVTAPAGTKITIKSGTSLGSDLGTVGIRILKDFTMVLGEDGKLKTEGTSLEEPKQPIKVNQKNAVLTLDKETVFGGNEKGIYLNTTDTFKVDTTWATKIKADGSDSKSGVFLNGTKIDAPIVRYFDGKLYVGLADAGIIAKDKDKVTVKGTFGLDGYGVSYKEVSFYYNGKIWSTKYEEAKPATYMKFAAESVHSVSSWDDKNQRWNIYLNVSKVLPGEIDKISFSTLVVEVNGKEIDTVVYHSYQDMMFFLIEGKELEKNCKDGTKITIKAGKALAADQTTGIELTKDFTFYTYRGVLTDVQPTNNTKWQEIEVISLNTTATYRKDAESWLVHLKLREPLVTELGTVYLDLPIQINGKSYTVKGSRDGEFLMLTIPDSILPGNTTKAEISIGAGAKAYANGGRNGLQLKEAFVMYVFNGVISEQQFEEIEEYEARIVGLQNALEDGDRYHVYLRLNKEFPGSAWYEFYDDFVYYYNGNKVVTSVRKSESSNNKFMYFGVEKSVVGTPKDGDVIKVAANTVMTCGGYKVTLTNDFQLMFEDGLWSQYMETDVKAPEDNKSLWEIARFDKEYIPTTKDGSVMYSNEDKYNRISSIEPMKDFTVSFNAKKIYDDETSPSFGVILRGNPIDDDEPMTESLLNGYVITFSVLEIKGTTDDGEKSTWTGYINLWKNGENYSLLDQYRISYTHDRSDHPYFQYEKDYNYEFSIYNITETCVCITVKVNGKLAMRYYDEAGSDPFDPAVNAGTFQVYAGCPNYITDDIAELGTIISEKDTCKIGDKVRVAATYPSVLDGTAFCVDKEGATVENGVFVATKPGTYTVFGTYDGKELMSKTIVVEDVEAADKQESGKLPIIWIVIVASTVVVTGTVVTVLIIKKRKKSA